MKVIVTGVTGNVGTSTVQALGESLEIDEIVGLARREPTWTPPKTSWVEANILNSDLGAIFEGADVVIHLAWAIQHRTASMNVKQVLADLGQVVLLVVAQRVYCPQDAYLGLGEAEVLAREIEALLKADCASFSSIEYREPLLEQCGLQQHLETVLEMKEDGRLPPVIVDTVECGRRSPQR